mmetsp:Transcript_2373/g.2321  ORF Transcript_2373/g.2321 Transcript_2373/m.2321 type:complete len:96 (+) Transcript_2373:533-820(+)
MQTQYGANIYNKTFGGSGGNQHQNLSFNRILNINLSPAPTQTLNNKGNVSSQHHFSDFRLSTPMQKKGDKQKEKVSEEHIIQKYQLVKQENSELK